MGLVEQLEQRLQQAYSLIEQLDYRLKKVENTPNSFDWITAKQAMKHLKIKSEKTLVRLREEHQITYRKEVRKVEYFLPSLDAYLEKLHINKDIILERRAELKAA